MGRSVVIHRRSHARSTRVADAMRKGFIRHGMSVYVTDLDTPHHADVACVWGGNQRHLWDAYQMNSIPLLVAECGYLGDRDTWTSLGWDGLNGEARHRAGMPDDRWLAHHEALWRPWRGARRGPVLLVGQVANDASVWPLDIGKWYEQMVADLSPTAMALWFRPHPLRPGTKVPDGAVSVTGDLEAAFDAVESVVTYSSGVGVQAVVAGLPTLAASSRSMAYPMAAHTVDELRAQVEEPAGRRQWAADLAYAQWTDAELASGEAWEAMKSAWH